MEHTEKNVKITDSEWQIMDLIWNHAEQECSSVPSSQPCQAASGITQAALMELLGKRWNKNTVHTFLKRLCDKGYLEIVEDSSPHRYRPLADRRECEKEERQSFLQRVYQGSAERMVAAFIRDGSLTGTQAARLRKLLEDAEKNQEDSL